MSVLQNKTILVVDDEPDLREIISLELEFHDVNVHQASNISEAKEILVEQSVDLVVSDIRMPGGTGIELLNFVKEKNALLPKFILITGFADIKIQDAFHQGAEDLIHKPFSLNKLIQVIQTSLGPKKKMSLNGEEELISLQFHKTLAEALSDEDLKIGRGGLSLSLKERPSSIVPGSEAHYELTFLDQVLRFKAELKWTCPVGETKRFSMGLKIHEYDEGTHSILENFEVLHSGDNLKAFIPKY